MTATLRLPSLIAATLLAATAPAAPARAAFYSGEQIYALCTAERTSRDYVENTYECIAYITGAVDAFNAVRAANKQRSCLPSDVTIDRLRTATVDYLAQNPEARAGPAAALVSTAITARWPCAAPKPVRPARKPRRKG